MKKPRIVLIVVISLVVLSFLGWWIHKSKNKPLTPDEIAKSLEAGEPLIEDAGFIVPVKNISSKKITAGITIMPAVEQNGLTIKQGYIEVTQTWEPQEEKRIFIKYNVNKPLSRSPDYSMSKMFSVNR